MRSATEMIARKIQALHALTNLERVITINVGLVNGGQWIKTITANSSRSIDINYISIADREDILYEV